MSDERLRCAESALRLVPEDCRKVDAADVAGRERGHSFHQGMLIGWAWGQDERGRAYLDFLSEHRHPGMHAARYFTDGREEPIAIPTSMRAVSPDPAEDAKLERDFVERNRAAYADLRERGLLPAEGGSVGSQGINEYLLKGGSATAGSGPDAATAAAGASDVRLGGGWDEPLRGELEAQYWSELLDFVICEHENHEVYPPWAQTFKAFELTPYEAVRVVIVGQDPYPNTDQATGLAFSVPPGFHPPFPASLRNIFEAMREEGIKPPDGGDLTHWAKQGVLLLNTALTVPRGKAGAHVAKWRPFTEAVISRLNSRAEPVVFVLWGVKAQRLTRLITAPQHHVIKAPHPAARGTYQKQFRESRTFTELAGLGLRGIEWGSA